MQFKPLGHSELKVSPLAFGGNVLGWTIHEPHAFDILDAFVASGCNFIDTANVYARWATGVGGESETLLGNWFRKNKNRNNIILATKVGMDMGKAGSGLSRKHIMASVEASLKRLQCEYIDLYQSHKDDESVPQEETLSAYQDLIKEGKIRYIGASNYSAARLEQAMETSKRFHLPGYISLQPHYNLLERKAFETELEPLCEKHGLGVINYFPLASGFLSGKYRTQEDFGKSVRGSSMGKFLNPKGLSILSALDSLSDKHRSNPAAITLAWYLSRKSISAPIVSATSVQQLDQLLEATRLSLDSKDIELLHQCSMY